MKTASEIVNKSSYGSQIRSEDWKSFAAGIRSKRGNFCECCKRAGVVTQVHHVFYEPGKKLWESSEDDLIVLCESCHKELHEHLQKFRKFVFRKLNPQSFRVLNGALAVALEQYNPLEFAHALAEFVSNPGLVERHCKTWRDSE